MQKKTIAASLAAVAAGSVGAASSLSAADPDTINWSSVPTSEVVLFYPGQATQEWVLNGSVHSGARGTKMGESCLSCHEKDAADIGDRIVGGTQLASGPKLEPYPVAGKPGSVKVTVQAAYDKETFYIRASWPTNAKEPGVFHDYKGFKDGKWSTYAAGRTYKEVREGKAKVSYEDRFNIMFGDNKGAVANFENQGCWVACHNSMRDTPNEPTKEQVKAHPILGDAGMKKTDIRKYIMDTRTESDDAGGWNKVKPQADLDALMAKGVFLDLWQARTYRALPVGKADDSHVFQYRNFDKGRKPFDNNWDADKKQPLFMFDPAKNDGQVALTEAQFRDPKAPKLNDANSIPFDATKIKDGDLLPGFILNTRQEGSAADLNASGKWENGVWTITLWRKLNTGQKDDIALAPDQTYPIGIAVHDDASTTRFHYVSLPLKLSLGKKDGHINAVELK